MFPLIMIVAAALVAAAPAGAQTAAPPVGAKPAAPPQTAPRPAPAPPQVRRARPTQTYAQCNRTARQRRLAGAERRRYVVLCRNGYEPAPQFKP